MASAAIAFACSTILSKACLRDSSHTFAYDSIFPPTNCLRPPIMPCAIFGDRTTIPRATPRYLSMWQPLTSFPVVTIRVPGVIIVKLRGIGGGCTCFGSDRWLGTGISILSLHVRHSINCPANCTDASSGCLHFGHSKWTSGIMVCCVAPSITFSLLCGEKKSQNSLGIMLSRPVILAVGAAKAAGWQARSPLFELVLALVPLDHVASGRVNANHSIM